MDLIAMDKETRSIINGLVWVVILDVALVASAFVRVALSHFAQQGKKPKIEQVDPEKKEDGADTIKAAGNSGGSKVISGSLESKKYPIPKRCIGNEMEQVLKTRNARHYAMRLHPGIQAHHPARARI